MALIRWTPDKARKNHFGFYPPDQVCIYKDGKVSFRKASIAHFESLAKARSANVYYEEKTLNRFPKVVYIQLLPDDRGDWKFRLEHRRPSAKSLYLGSLLRALKIRPGRYAFQEEKPGLLCLELTKEPIAPIMQKGNEKEQEKGRERKRRSK